MTIMTPVRGSASFGSRTARLAFVAFVCTASTIAQPLSAKPVGGESAANVVTEPCALADKPIVANAVSSIGLIAIAITSPCRKGQTVTLAYAGHRFETRLDNGGEALVNLDLFAGRVAAHLDFSDGTRAAVDTSTAELGGLSKVALVWKQPVDLDLHALEYSAKLDGPGHVWTKAPSSAREARASVLHEEQGRGFISTAMDGSTAGDQVEVYTFLHASSQKRGIVSLLVDYASRSNGRADTCGEGANAEVAAEIFRFEHGHEVPRERIVIRPLDCGAVTGRLLRYGIRDLRAR